MSAQHRGRGLFAQPLAGVLGPYVGLALVIGLFAAHPDAKGFISTLNFQTVAAQTVIVGLGAIGMTFVIVSGGIDLSVGSVIALSSVVTALGVNAGLPVVLAAGLGVLVGGLCGACTGLMITGLRIAPFIASLGMFGIARGAAKFLAEEQKVDAPSTWLSDFMANRPQPEWLFVAPAVWMMFALAIVMAFVLRRTAFGVHTFAIGSNEDTARLCGVPVEQRKVVVYALCGLFAGLAGVMSFGNLAVGDPTTAMGKELDIIAAVVIGGASLAGGEGRMSGSLIGAFIMAFLVNGLTLSGEHSYTQDILIGAIIVAAVALDSYRHRRS